LFAAACCRRIWSLLGDQRSRRAVEALERSADREEMAVGLAVAAREAQDAAEELQDTDTRHAARAVANAVFADSTEAEDGDDELTWEILWDVEFAVPAASRAPGDALYGDDEGADMAWVAAVKSEEGAQSGLLRDIFGNPFHPVAIDPAWLVPGVVNLA